MKKIFISIFLLIFLTGCSSDKTSLKSDYKTIKTKNKEQYLMVGFISSDLDTNISSCINEKVDNVFVKVGDKVKKNQVLLTLNSESLKAKLNQAQAGVDISKASLQNIQSGNRPEQILSAEANYNSSSKFLDIAKKNYERTKSLFDNGALSQKDLEVSQEQLTSAEASMQNSLQQLNILKKGSTKENLEIYKAQLKQAEASLKVIESEFKNINIVSPIDGSIVYKNINSGEYVNSGKTLFTISSKKGFFVNSYVPTDIVKHLEVNQNVKIKISELDNQKFVGKILAINEKINDNNRDVLVKISIEKPSENLKTGMFAEIALSKN